MSIVMQYDDRLVRSYEKRMIVENEKHWGDVSFSEGEGYIFVLHAVPEELHYSTAECVIAKGLQEKCKLPILGFQDLWCKKSIADLDRSFGIQPLDSAWDSEIKIRLCKKLEKVAKKISARTGGDPQKILKITYRGIECGDAIYDMLIRGTMGKSPMVKDIQEETRTEIILHSLVIIEMSYLLFRRYKPKYVITSEYVYIHSLFIRVAQEFGADFIRHTIGPPNVLVKIPPSCSELYAASIFKEICEQKASTMTVPSSPGDLFAFKFENTKLNYLDNGKPNVFIMCHALLDCPRENSKMTIFTDYFNWFVQTLQIIREIKDVNWHIKEHPQATFFMQDQHVREVFEQYKTDSMFWCDKSIGGQQIREYADAIVTCCGSAGIEYWAYGIPTVTASNAFYVDWGISYNAKSMEDYQKLLRHIGELEKPSHESITLAKKYLYIFRHIFHEEDGLMSALWETEKKRRRRFNVGEQIGRECHFFFAEKYIDLLHKDAIRTSPLYTLEAMIEVRT